MSNYKKVLRSLVFGLATILVMGGAAYALTTVTGHLKFDGTVPGAIEKITFGTTGGSSIYDDWNLHIKTDDNLYLDVPGITVISNDVTIAETLGVTGAATVGGTLGVTGDATFAGDVAVAGAATVTGNLGVTGTVTATAGFVGSATGTTETTFTFGSGSDADDVDMTVNLGGTDPAILQWTHGTHLLSFTDNLAITGATALTGALTVGGNVDLGDTAGDTIDIIGGTTVTDTTLATGGHALTVNGTLHATGTASERGIAAEFKSKIGTEDAAVATASSTSGVSMFTYVDDANVTLGGDIRGLFVGVEEDHDQQEGGAAVDANLSGGNVYGIAIYLEFDTNDAPHAIYPFRLNVSNKAVDGLFFATGYEAIGLNVGDPGDANDGWLEIHFQLHGEVWRIPLYKVP